MVKTIILFALAVAVSLLLGVSIGTKKAYGKGFIDGSTNANSWWKNRLPKDIFDNTVNDAFEELFDRFKD